MSKGTKAEAKYEDPSKHEGKYCNDCEHFKPPHGCEEVEGFIRRGAYCEWYERAVQK